MTKIIKYHKRVFLSRFYNIIMGRTKKKIAPFRVVTLNNYYAHPFICPKYITWMGKVSKLGFKDL